MGRQDGSCSAVALNASPADLDFLAGWASFAPDRDAVLDADSGERWSYARLDDLSRRVEAWLERTFAPAPGDRVAVLGKNSIVHLAAFFACWRRRWTLVPLNWRLARPELAAVLADADPRALLLEEDAAWEGTAVTGVPFREVLAAAARETPSTRPSETAPEDVPLLLYTSGTTGRPKGAMLSARMLVANAIQTCVGWELGPTDTAPLFAPLFHTGGWNVLTLPLLHRGGRVLLMSRFDPSAVLCWLPETTALFGVPTMFQTLWDAGIADCPTGRLRLVICGGAPCPLPLLQRYHDAGIALRQGFGMTEAGPNCFRFPPGREREKAGAVGLPQVHTRVRIVDGELQVGGAHLFSGYWRNPAATAETLRDGWVATGDVAEVDADGFYRIVGRKKEMYISGGENVYPGEVERALVDHPSVAEAAVLGAPDPLWGEVGHAFVVVRGGAPGIPGAVDGPELARFCRDRLAGYKVPRRFSFLAALPRNAMGKVLKSALREEALRGAAQSELGRVSGGQSSANAVESPKGSKEILQRRNSMAVFAKPSAALSGLLLGGLLGLAQVAGAPATGGGAAPAGGASGASGAWTVLDGVRLGGGGVAPAPVSAAPAAAANDVVRVVVLDGANGAPLPGAWVRRGADGPLALTDLSGRAELPPEPGVAAGAPAVVTASKTGFSPTSLGLAGARGAAIPLFAVRPARGSLRDLSREVLAGRLVPRNLDAFANGSASFSSMMPAIGGAWGAQGANQLGQVSGGLLFPAGFGLPSARAGALLARLDGMDTTVQMGGGWMNAGAGGGGAVPPSAFRLVAPRAPDASEWAAELLARGPGGIVLGRMALPSAPPFDFGSPFVFAPLPVPLAGGRTLRWSALPGGPSLVTLGLELPDGRLWTVLLPGAATSFSVPTLPGGRPAAFRWTVAKHAFPALNQTFWKLRDLEPLASSFALPRVEGQLAFDARLFFSPLVSLYSLPENGAFLVERKGRDPVILTY
ncbi:MAG: AMP-binding protein [Planctomycetes bacterium]|nr:AMP-binding protein [Planctomycetota bacterium]